MWYNFRFLISSAFDDWNLLARLKIATLIKAFAQFALQSHDCRNVVWSKKAVYNLIQTKLVTE